MGKFKAIFFLVIFSVSVAVPLDALAKSDRDEWAGYEPEDMYDPEEFTGLLGDWYGQRRKLADKGFTIDIDVTQSYDGVALSQLVFTQFLSESFSVYFGKIDTTDGDSTRFSGARGKDNFMNSNLVFNPVPLRVVPLSSLGAGVLFIWPDVHAERPATLALSVIGANGQPNTAGWDDDFEDGAAYTIAYRQPTNFFGKDGAHTFAAAYNSKDLTILDQDPRLMLESMLGFPVTLEENDGTWALMYNFDQYLFNEEKDPTQGFGLFGRFAIADEETNTADQFYSIGLGGKGIFEGRDEDTFGVGYFYTKLSGELPRLIRDAFDDAQGFEVFYNIEVAKGLHITPDFQILDSSNESVGTAYVAGIRIKIDF